MSEYVAHVKWGRVVLAGIAAHLVDDLVFALIPFAGWFFSPFTALITPALTGLLALWVAHTVDRGTAVKHGLMVGAISGTLAFFFALPSAWALVAAGMAAGAGALGGLAGHQTRRDRPAVEDGELHRSA